VHSVNSARQDDRPQVRRDAPVQKRQGDGGVVPNVRGREHTGHDRLREDDESDGGPAPVERGARDDPSSVASMSSGSHGG